MLSFIGGELVTVPSSHLPAVGKGRIKTRRYSSRRPVRDDDGGGTSEHHASKRPRQTERGGSISAETPDRFFRPPYLITMAQAEAVGVLKGRQLGW